MEKCDLEEVATFLRGTDKQHSLWTLHGRELDGYHGNSGTFSDTDLRNFCYDLLDAFCDQDVCTELTSEAIQSVAYSILYAMRDD